VINLLAERSDGKISSIRSISLDMRAGESTEKRFAWVPPAPGQWTIYASLASQTSTMLSRSVTTLAVKPGPGVDPRSVIATVSQQGNLATPVAAALLLLAGGVSAILLFVHLREMHGSR